jgi:hypothetical protein
MRRNMKRKFLCLYTYCRWRSSNQEGRVGIPLTGLTRPHFCACLKPEHGFPTSYVGTVVVYFVFSEIIYVIFVDIDGILISVRGASERCDFNQPAWL